MPGSDFVAEGSSENVDPPVLPRSRRQRGQPVLQRRRQRGHAKARVGAVLAVAAVVAFAVWLVLRPGKSTTPPTGTVGAATAVAVSPQGLTTIANALGQPIYWAGAQRSMTYELTQSPDDRVYVRYLPKGVKVGASKPYLTIATYPVDNAYAATLSAAKQAGSVRLHAVGGAVAFYSRGHRTSVYEAFPRSNYQVEVYSPSASQAQRIVREGKIRSVGGGTGAAAAAAQNAGAVAAKPADLKAAAIRLGRSIYWLGSEGGKTYELTETPDGRVYVRYLPAGVKVGAPKPYLTVATYPVKGAYATTAAAATHAGTTTIKVKNGIAFYNRGDPTSVYVAFKGSNEQIEVFDPNAGQAHHLVAAGKVRSVSS